MPSTLVLIHTTTTTMANNNNNNDSDSDNDSFLGSLGSGNNSVDTINSNDERFDQDGNVLSVANLTFVEGILGRGEYGTVRLARRKGGAPIPGSGMSVDTTTSWVAQAPHSAPPKARRGGRRRGLRQGQSNSGSASISGGSVAGRNRRRRRQGTNDSQATLSNTNGRRRRQKQQQQQQQQQPEEFVALRSRSAPDGDMKDFFTDPNASTDAEKAKASTPVAGNKTPSRPQRRVKKMKPKPKLGFPLPKRGEMLRHTTEEPEHINDEVEDNHHEQQKEYTMTLKTSSPPRPQKSRLPDCAEENQNGLTSDDDDNDDDDDDDEMTADGAAPVAVAADSVCNDNSDDDDDDSDNDIAIFHSQRRNRKRGGSSMSVGSFDRFLPSSPTTPTSRRTPKVVDKIGLIVRTGLGKASGRLGSLFDDSDYDSDFTFDNNTAYGTDQEDGAPGGEEEEMLVAVKIHDKSILKRIRRMERDKKTRRMKVHTALEQVEQEIALMKKMHHPNLVALYDVIDSPESDNVYMVLEYMPLGEILSYQDNGTFYRKDEERNDELGYANGHFDEQHVALFFVDILHGLAYLHRHHICHRDLKPENIL